MRDAFARAVYDQAKQDSRVCVIVADISPAGAMAEFRRDFPDRFINVGVAEQSMIGIAAGLAQRGMRPFCYTISTFALFRAYEFIRCDLAYQRLPVTIVGMGAGFNYPTLGGTHLAVEDVSVAMACPELRVLAPCDVVAVEECVKYCVGRYDSDGPTYMRIGKAGEHRELSPHAPAWPVEGLRWLRGGPIRNVNDNFLFLTYGPVASEVLAAAEKVNAAVVTLCDLSVPFTGSRYDTLYDAVTGFSETVVVEEASGAPLYHAVAPMVADYCGGSCGMSLHSVALPDDAWRAHYATRAEALHAYGMSAERLAQMKWRRDQ